jgi:N-acetylglucosamine kinase-like BadF-type ATPase
MDEGARVLGWGRGGPTHGLYVGLDAATRSVRDAVLGATADFRPAISYIAGCGLHAGLNEWLQQPFSLDQLLPCGEPALGFATALTTHGILVLSGTGSFVHGLTADGRCRHEGGNGPIVADEGSAYHIGILGVRAALRADYAARRRTSLTLAVPRALGVKSLQDVFHLLYVERIGRSRVASIARAVNAEAGDQVAAAILRRAAEELGELLVEVIRELGFEASSERMVATGSVAQGSRVFWDRLCEIALAVAPGLTPVQPRVRPVVGACLLALRKLGGEWGPHLIDRIVETQQPFLQRLDHTPADPARATARME